MIALSEWGPLSAFRGVRDRLWWSLSKISTDVAAGSYLPMGGARQTRKSRRKRKVEKRPTAKRQVARESTIRTS